MMHKSIVTLPINAINAIGMIAASIFLGAVGMWAFVYWKDRGMIKIPAPSHPTESMSMESRLQEMEKSALPVSGPVISASEGIMKYKLLTFPDNTLDTSNWETYQSKEFGFEMKYPKNAFTISDKQVSEMKEMHEFGSYLDWHLGRVDFKPLSGEGGLRMYVYEKDVDTMFKLYSKLSKAPYDIIGNIPVNNTQFFFLTPRDDTQPWNLSRYQGEYFAGDAGRAYEIVLADISSEQMKTFQEILSTFKLIR